MNTDVTIRRVGPEGRATINNLATAYFREVLPDGPTFVPNTLDPYWRDVGRYPYLIDVGDTPAGFALVWTHPDGTHELAEFTISPAFRHHGIGTLAAQLIFEALSGDWKMGIARHFPGAMAFWKHCLEDTMQVHEITQGPPRTEHQIASFTFRVAR